MNGTLALWFEGRPPAAGQAATPSGKLVAPEIRLHVNLWRDLDKDFNFLDFGFLITEVNDLGRLYLFVPAPIGPNSILDLSNALRDADTLNAVFNEVALIEREEDTHFVVQTGSTKRRVIHLVDPQTDLGIHAVNVPGRGRGTIIALKSRLCARIASAALTDQEHYVRLRIYLQGKARNLFTTEDTNAGIGLSLTQDVLETTEFRLNERRSYPPEILRRATNGQICLRSVHYFLIRRKNYQLGSQHQNFRKVRYLEPDIWTSYISVGRPASSRRSRTAKSAEGMIIYQWREIAQVGESLDDFIAYASFRSVRPRIVAYLVAILAIGGVGSAAHNVAVGVLNRAFDALGWVRPTAGYASLYAGFGLAALALMPMALAWVVQWRRR